MCRPQPHDRVGNTRHGPGGLNPALTCRTAVAKKNYATMPQTYSMVGIVNGAMRLSRRWETVV